MTPPSVDPSLIYRTPEERFVNVPDFGYTPQYAHWGNIRYAYIDVTGPVFDLKTGGRVADDEAALGKVRTETVLCLHGEPTWSFLYRKMIPGFLNCVSPRRHVPDDMRFVRRRILAPDFIGFGRSDKPAQDDYYTWDQHRNWLVHFVTQHIVHDTRTAQGGRVTLVVQDWGGLLGLILPNLFPALFTHLIVMNTGLGVGVLPSKAWVAFRDFIARSPNVDVGALLQRGTPLSQREIDAYRAPFPNAESKAGVRRFPQLVPTHPNMRGVADSRAALQYFQSLAPVAYTTNTLAVPFAPQSQGQDGQALGVPLQVFVCVGKADPVLGLPVMQALAQSAFAQSTGYWWHVIDDGGHFVQEWSAHVPGLADRAWSGQPTGHVQYDHHKAAWYAAKGDSML